MAINRAAAFATAVDNYTRLLLLVTQVIASPTQANVDAVVAAADGSGIIRPKPTYSADGESWDWTGYQNMLIGQFQTLLQTEQRIGGPFEVQIFGR